MARSAVRAKLEIDWLTFAPYSLNCKVDNELKCSSLIGQQLLTIGRKRSQILLSCTPHNRTADVILAAANDRTPRREVRRSLLTWACYQPTGVDSRLSAAPDLSQSRSAAPLLKARRVTHQDRNSSSRLERKWLNNICVGLAHWGWRCTQMMAYMTIVLFLSWTTHLLAIKRIRSSNPCLWKTERQSYQRSASSK